MSKPKLNQPDVEITTTTFNSETGESITINKTIPSIQFEEIFVTGMSIKENYSIEDALNDFLNDGWTFDYDLYGNCCFIKRHEMFSDTKIYIKANQNEYVVYAWDEKNHKESNAIIGYKTHNLLHNFLKAKGWVK